jgi:hypothetical protein
MATDAVYEQLKKLSEKKEELIEEVSVPVSKRERVILEKKAAAVGINVGELLRAYLTKIQAFDGSCFEKKKGEKLNNEGVN